MACLHCLIIGFSETPDYSCDLLCSMINCVFIVFFFNSQFVSKVNEKFPKDTDLIVACQKGLRCALCSTNCSFSYNFGFI